MYWMQADSPIGYLTLSSDGQAITGLWMETHRALPHFPDDDRCPELPVFQKARTWLDAYFTGAPLPPLPPLAPAGTPFQKEVWCYLQQIPHGETTTYGTISRALRDRGIPAAPQAVGGAVGRNPISILIPCHRVLGADGSLTGYAGGLSVKQQLLHLEGVL